MRGRRVPVCAAAGLPFGRAVVQPEHASIANAYGAAVAEVGGEVDFMFFLATITRSSALAWAEREAQRRAAEAGADPAALRTVPPSCGVPWSGGASRSRLCSPCSKQQCGVPEAPASDSDRTRGTKKGRRRPNHDATSNTAISSCWVSRRLMETQTFTSLRPSAGTD